MPPSLPLASGRSHAAPARPAAVPLAVARPTAAVLPLLDAVTFAPYELDRAAGLSSAARREDYLAAHALVRLCAARLLGVDAAALMLGQRCGQCGGEDHGRPFLRDRPDVGVSLSHTRGAVAAAAAPGPVGVDVEDAVRRGLSLQVAARVLAPAELAVVRAAADPARSFLHLWVRKEALVKVGVTALGELRETDLTLSGGLAARRFVGWRFAGWSSSDGGLIAAAVARTAPAFDNERDLSSPRFSSKEPRA